MSELTSEISLEEALNPHVIVFKEARTYGYPRPVPTIVRGEPGFNTYTTGPTTEREVLAHARVLDELGHIREGATTQRAKNEVYAAENDFRQVIRPLAVGHRNKRWNAQDQQNQR